LPLQPVSAGLAFIPDSLSMCPTSGVATWVPAAIPLPEGQVALTLREVCGLTTEEIARAFLVTPGDARAAHRAREDRHPR
jgi:hypothetical protein